MPKIKNIVIPAVFGFALSFLISVLVTRRFGFSLLRGLIFGFVFAVLAALIDLVYGRFLNDGSPSESVAADGAKPEARTGGTVDLTIGDADLTDEGDNLRFAVNNNVFKLSAADTRSARKAPVFADEPERPEPAAAPSAAPREAVAAPDGAGNTPAPVPRQGAEAAPAFQPITLGKPLPKEEKGGSQEAPKREVKAPENLSPAAAARRAEREADKKEIDALPDLDSFGDEDMGEPDDGDVIEDSEFAEDGRRPSSGGRGGAAGGSKAMDHDTETLAKAIRTLLKKDD